MSWSLERFHGAGICRLHQRILRAYAPESIAMGAIDG